MEKSFKELLPLLQPIILESLDTIEEIIKNSLSKEEIISLKDSVLQIQNECIQIGYYTPEIQTKINYLIEEISKNT